STCWPQAKLVPPTVDWRLGLAVSQGLPAVAVGLILPASSTAPTALTLPAPWVRREVPAESGTPRLSFRASGWAVYSRIAFTLLGVRFGLACSVRATAPETIAAPMLVPESI